MYQPRDHRQADCAHHQQHSVHSAGIRALTACRGGSESTTASRKGRRSRRRSTTSSPPSRGECTAPCVAPWQGARSPSTTRLSPPLLTVASRASARPSGSNPPRPLRCPRAAGGPRGDRARARSPSSGLPRAPEREGRDHDHLGRHAPRRWPGDDHPRGRELRARSRRQSRLSRSCSCCGGPLGSPGSR